MMYRRGFALGLLVALSCSLTSANAAEDTKTQDAKAKVETTPAAETNLSTEPAKATTAPATESTTAKSGTAPAAVPAKAPGAPAAAPATVPAAGTAAVPPAAATDNATPGKSSDTASPASPAASAPPAPKSTGSYADHMTAAKAALAQKDNAKLLAELEGALQEADRTKDDFKVAEACNEIANYYMTQKDIERAAGYARRAKDTAIKILFADPKTQALASKLATNEENGSIWISHVMQAEFASNRSDFKTAEAEYQAAITKAEEYAADGMPMATALTGLGKTYVLEGKFKEAEPVLRRAIELCEKNWTPVTKNSAVDGADAMRNLATVLEKTGRRDEADKMAARSKQVKESKSFGK